MNRQTDWQSGRRRDRQTGCWTIGKPAKRDQLADGQTGRWVDEWIDQQMDGQADSYKNNQTCVADL